MIKKTYVYIVRGGAYVKVGVAKNPEKRLKEMQTGSPHLLRIVAQMPFETRKGAMDFERHVHKKLGIYHHHGEWFKDGCMREIYQSPITSRSERNGGFVETENDSRWVTAG